MLKYKYVLDDKGREINIEDVPREGHLKKSFTCIGCGGPMVAAIGPKRRYFRHKIDDTNCNKESYLHKLAKMQIKRKFDDKSKPFNIRLLGEYECERHCNMFKEEKCRMKRIHPPIDLHKWYDTCEEEKGVDGGYIADLLLSHSQYSDRKLLIEILVTHKCSEEKVDFGHKIIELVVDSEERINFLIEHDWSGDYSFFDFHNFYPQIRKSNSTEYWGETIGRFILYSSGKYYYRSIKCFEAKERHNLNSIMEFNVPWRFWGISDLEVAHYLKRKHNIEIKACIICRYSWHRRYNFLDDTCYCNLFPQHQIKNPGWIALECTRFELKWLKAAHIPREKLFKDEEVEIIVPYNNKVN